MNALCYFVCGLYFISGMTVSPTFTLKDVDLVTYDSTTLQNSKLLTDDVSDVLLEKDNDFDG